MAIRLGIGNIDLRNVRSFSWSACWATLISATVENAAPTHVVLTFPSAKTSLGAADFTVTVNGANSVITNATWVGGVLILTISDTVIYGDVIVVTFVETGGTANVTNNVTMLAELTTYITGLVTPLSAGQLTKLNRFIYEVEVGVGNISTYFDLLYVMAGETEESSLKNLAQNAYHMTKVLTPTFAALQGFTGATAGGNKYLKTGFIPSTHVVASSLNDMSHGVYIREAPTVGALQVPEGTYNAAPAATQIYMLPTYSNQVNHATNDGLGSASNYKQGYRGFYCGVRTAAAVTKTYVNYLKFSGTRTSVALPTKEIYVLARNLDGVVNSVFLKEVSLMFLGKALTEAQMYALMAAFEKYMDANSKGALFTSLGIIGDSITDIYTTVTAWPCNFDQTVYTVADFGATGHSIVLNSASDAALLTGNVYDKIIIQFGTNDDNAGNMALRQAEVEAAIVAIKAACPKATLYYLNILPRWTDAGGDTEVPKGNLRTAIAAACAAQGITCWDSYTTPWIISTDTTDGCHPTAAGAIKVYNEVLSRL